MTKSLISPRRRPSPTKAAAPALALALVLGAPAMAAAADRPTAHSLWTLSESVEALARRVHPCVVKIVAMGFAKDDENGGAEGIVNRDQSSGSGVVIDPTGIVVTNAHVLSGADRAQVTLPADIDRASGGVATVVGAKILGVDAETDVALLKVPLSGLPYLTLDASVGVRQGQAVLAFGSPMGLDDSVTLGIVSAPSRQLDPEDPVAYIQTDAPINPGSSGGPLIDAEGRVVGINTLILSQSGGSEGLGFALPIDLVATVAERLRRTGRTASGEIGLSARSNDPSLARAWQLPTQSGALIEDVDSDGPAGQAGLRSGDLIETLDGRPLTGLPALRLALYRAATGSRLRLGILRDGKRLTEEVEVREAPSAEPQLAAAASSQNLVPELGVFVLDMDEGLATTIGQQRGNGGVLVAAQLDRVPTLGESLAVDDILYRLNRKPVTDTARLRELVARAHPGEPLAFQVERNGQLRFVVMALP